MRGGQRVIGAEHVEDARRRGRLTLEILPGDIVTPLAQETAARLGLKLADGPLERPAIVRTDGATALRRGLYRRSPKWVAPVSRTARAAGPLGKLALVGTGGVGSALALLASKAEAAREIALIDVMPGLAEATALDLNHMSGMSRSKAHAVGSTDLAQVDGADVVVVTAGRPRTPGMTRADLLDVNRRVIHAVAEAIRTRAPDSIVITVTNPLDEIAKEMLDATGFPRERVLGMAGTLDGSRFRHALAEAAGVPVADVEAVCLGTHGDEMVPIVSRARIKGRSLDLYLSADALETARRAAVSGGGQVVALRKTGSATLAPAHATMELIDHIRGSCAGLVPASVMLEGEYGIEGVVLGVPCHLGRSGLIEIEELMLADSELQALRHAAAALRARQGG